MVKLRDVPALPVAIGVWLVGRLLPATHESTSAEALSARLPRLKIRHQFLDVRSREAFDAGHVRRAVHLDVVSAGAVSRARRLRREHRMNDGLLYVYDVQGESLAQVEALLRRAGFRNVRYVEGGYEALTREGMG